MKKGNGTRSGLLWEVERLLNEVDNLPQLLLMENVPQVHSKKNKPDFEEWINFLENKGYSNYWKDLNAKDYGVAQNRNRCFMVSILGNYSFTFPEPQKLDKDLKDYLEENVDEKYYIDNKKAQVIINNVLDENNSRERAGIDLSINHPRQIEISNCIKARYDSGISNRQAEGTGIIEFDNRKT